MKSAAVILFSFCLVATQWLASSAADLAGAAAQIELNTCSQCSMACSCDDASCCVRGEKSSQDPISTPPAGLFKLDLKGRSSAPAPFLENLDQKLRSAEPLLSLPPKRTMVPVYYWNCALLI
jgi:hypothetical protein